MAGGPHRPSAEHDRNNTIDAFRAVAIVSVVLFHYLVHWAPPDNPVNVYGYHNTYPPALSTGALGVHLFFIISGLVITMTILGCRNAIEFAVKRFARLYPAFLVAMCLTFAIAAYAGVPAFQTSWADFFANLTMNARDLHHRYIDGAYWSLSVEVKFYFYVALSFALVRKRFWILILAVAIAGAALSPFNFGNSVLIAPYMPFFLLGMAVWYWLYGNQTRPAALLGVAAIVLYVYYSATYENHFGPKWLSHAYLAFATTLMIALLWSRRPFRFPVLAPLGRASYSLYLLHQVIGVILIRWFVREGVPDLTAAALAAATCIAGAFAMYHAIEQPGRKAIMSLYRTLSMKFARGNDRRAAPSAIGDTQAPSPAVE